MESGGLSSSSTGAKHISDSKSGVCSVCGAGAFESWLAEASDYLTGDRFRLARCLSCDTAFTFPEPASMNRYYEHKYRSYGRATSALLRILYHRRAKAWSRAIRGRGSVLEIGCGAGWMLEALRQDGWEVFSSERTLDTAKHVAKTLNAPIFVGSIDAVAENRFDVIVLFHVLEHLANPKQVLDLCARALKPCGTLIVAVPNARSWQARVFRRHWFHLDVPRHLVHFSPQSLRTALLSAGLVPTGTTFLSIEHDPVGWIQSTLNTLGFPQNQLVRRLVGTDRHIIRDSAMVCLALLLLAPSIILSCVTWISGSGAVMETHARKPAANGQVSQPPE